MPGFIYNQSSDDRIGGTQNITTIGKFTVYFYVSGQGAGSTSKEGTENMGKE